MKDKEVKKVRINLVKIFLDPPKSFFERVSLFFIASLLFVVFFRPLGFENMSFFEAVITASIPSLSISWGWIVLLRSLFRKEDYKK